MAKIGRNGFLRPPSSGPVYGKANRLSWEARRNVFMIETGMFLGIGLIFTRVQRFFENPSFDYGILVASTALSMITALWARRRLLARAAWLETTDQWWERLDEMPHIVLFPRLQQRLQGLSVRSLLPRRRPAAATGESAGR